MNEGTRFGKKILHEMQDGAPQKADFCHLQQPQT